MPFLDTELHNGAGAEVAGHQRGIERGVAKTAESPRATQAIDLGVRHRIVVLHATIMTAEMSSPFRASTEPIGMPPSSRLFLACAIAACMCGYCFSQLIG